MKSPKSSPACRIEHRIGAVFFDLDGTFADTAPDLAAAINRLLAERGMAGLPPKTLRPYVSQGARGLLRIGIGLSPGDPGYAEALARFVALYAENLCEETVPFPGIDILLAQIEAKGIPWGIVTNKAERFSLPLLEKMGYRQRAACIVSGDSAQRPKPAPDLLQLAAKLTGVAPGESVFIGDDPRDVEAGRAAAMSTIAVRWGYLGDGPPIEAWGADFVVGAATEITALLGLG
ncbi:MAG: HAD-IA family hydrolase [Betaproteobacteria bacterium]|nr:HAD-IA family hydrolase [Betaproteobacteria bacterium]